MQCREVHLCRVEFVQSSLLPMKPKGVRDRSSAEHLLSEGCAAHSKNWEVRLEVMRPPSCRMTSGRTAGQTSSLSSRMWSKCCRTLAGVCPVAPIRRPANQCHSSYIHAAEAQSIGQIHTMRRLHT